MSSSDLTVEQQDKTDAPSVIKDPNVQIQFDKLPEADKVKLMKAVSMMENEEEVSRRKQEASDREKKETMLKISTDRLENTQKESEKELSQSVNTEPVSILKIDTSEKNDDKDNEDSEAKNENISSGGMKKISFDTS
jgi:hypothetical protein